MNNVLNYIGGGIKCDNPECDYTDPNVSIEEYGEWLNKPCPKCSANLLTQADYDNVQAIIAAVSAINKVFPVPEGYEDEPKVFMHISMDGTGKMDFEFTDKKSE